MPTNGRNPQSIGVEILIRESEPFPTLLAILLAGDVSHSVIMGDNGTLDDESIMGILRCVRYCVQQGLEENNVNVQNFVGNRYLRAIVSDLDAR